MRTFQKKCYFCSRDLLIMGNLGYGAYPTHPGEVLKDEIESRGISQTQLFQNLINHSINLLFPLVRMNLEIRVAGEHGGELGLSFVVEDMARDAETFSVGEFVADTERRASTFAD